MVNYSIQEEYNNTQIIRHNEDGSLSYIPMDEANSDYQAYLESLEPKAKAPKVVDEAASL
jgi:hypothetical protein